MSTRNTCPGAPRALSTSGSDRVAVCVQRAGRESWRRGAWVLALCLVVAIADIGVEGVGFLWEPAPDLLRVERLQRVQDLPRRRAAVSARRVGRPRRRACTAYAACRGGVAFSSRGRVNLLFLVKEELVEIGAVALRDADELAL